MKYKNIIFFLIITFLILGGFELGSYIYLKNKNKQKSLFIHTNNKPQDDYGFKIYHQIDPLLGWSVGSERFEEMNFVEQHQSVFFKSVKQDCDTFKVIYISGGSASDLFFDQDNWPLYLYDLVKDDFCIKMYVSAVAGYNSGQELLKLMRDLSEIKPDIHLSYSGANEMENPAFVSRFEENLFNQMNQVQFSTVLPNLTFWLNSMIANNNIQISELKKMDAIVFWNQNMQTMQALASLYEYRFIGILQPVLGFGSPIPDDIDKDIYYYHNIQDYALFYPEAIGITHLYPFIYDYTVVFEQIEENVFIDDCHLKDVRYQQLIAESIFREIKEYLNFSQ